MPSSGFTQEKTSFYLGQDWKILQNQTMKLIIFHFLNFQNLKISAIIVKIVGGKKPNAKECNENSFWSEYLGNTIFLFYWPTLPPTNTIA